MELTNKQEEAVKTIVERYNNKEKYTVLSGYAGTGKSVTIAHALYSLPVRPEEIAYACFTGKAAQRLIDLGVQNDVYTLHKLLYNFRPLPSGGFSKTKKQRIPYKVIIVDEVGMADKELTNLLLTYPLYVVFCGDPGQLSPINPETDNHLLDNPHIFLDEVLRQAQESEIIRLSMDIRNGKSINNFDGKEVKIVNQSDINTGYLEWADQIICATNAKRRMLNAQMRIIKGLDGVPQIGDKVICNRNYWDVVSDINEEPLTNGIIGEITSIYEDYVNLPKYIYNDALQLYFAKIENSKGDTFSVIMDKKMINNGEKSLTWQQESRIKNGKYKIYNPLEFEYSYAISLWKAQGSSWGKVLGFEEGHPFDKKEHQKYLYTLCTRAEDKLIIVKK